MASKEIPEEIQQKIDEIASNRTYTLRDTESRRHMEAEYIRQLLEQGYSLAMEEMAERDKKI